MNTGDLMLYIQIPDEHAAEMLRPLAEKYGWSGLFKSSRRIVYPAYISICEDTYKQSSWQDNFPNLYYKELEQNYHNGIPYTDFLQQHGITTEQSYEYW